MPQWYWGQKKTQKPLDARLTAAAVRKRLSRSWGDFGHLVAN